MKKLLLFLFTILLPIVAKADYSGSCGTNVTYTYVESTQTLTISGSGDMTDFLQGNTPWYNYRDEILKITIENGVKSIGDFAFYKCDTPTSITVPNSVTRIGNFAFSDCI